MSVVKISDELARYGGSTLLRAIAAQLEAELPKAPYDPAHEPFGHVRLSPQGGWLCGVVGCGKPVKSVQGTWRHIT